ncbi:MAG: PDZ domain-containing protein [Calditrichaeota bacterium]|nr:MAG: PDZ domain-containing protein [Calditrichota bacterium]
MRYYLWFFVTRLTTLMYLFFMLTGIDSIAQIPSTESRLDSWTGNDIHRYSFHSIIEKVLPATVGIEAQKPQTKTAKNLASDLFRNKKNDTSNSLQKLSSGAGVIISPDGYIITNTHLINGAGKIVVNLFDNRHFIAETMGLDVLSEIAVIKITAPDLEYVRLGNSDQCLVGDRVLAVGNPLNLKFTVTSGIISAIGREVDIINHNYAVESFIQTDAAINPGNSGGPLINMVGEVIGINTAIATETGVNMGFGFAVPANIVRKISGELIKYGKIDRAYLGAAFLDVNSDIALALDLAKVEGVFVDDVFLNSPAEQFGLKPLDVILSINGTRINHANQLQAKIAKEMPGEKVWIELLRNQELINIAVELGSLAGIGLIQEPAGDMPESEYYGIRVRKLTAEDRYALNIDNSKGVLISKIKQHSPADLSGLKVDDIIISVDGTSVANEKDFYQKLDSFPREVLLVAVQRSQQRFHFFLRNY